MQVIVPLGARLGATNRESDTLRLAYGGRWTPRRAEVAGEGVASGRRTEGAGGSGRVRERERNKRQRQALVAARERGRGTGGGERRVREREDELAAACERGCARMREMV